MEEATLFFKGSFRLLCPQRQLPFQQIPESQPGIKGQSLLALHDGAGACAVVEVGGAAGSAVVVAAGGKVGAHTV